MSTVTVRMTTPLRKFVGGQREVQVHASTVSEVLSQLNRQFPELNGRLTEPDGRLREFIQLHIGREPLSERGGLSAVVQSGEVIAFSSPFSGG